MVKCTKCKTNEKTPYNSWCKKCNYDSRKAWRDRQRDDKTYYVYYLPEEHYAGITFMLSDRMVTHRQHGMNTEGCKILAEYKDKAEARHHENLLHSWMGMNGINMTS